MSNAKPHVVGCFEMAGSLWASLCQRNLGVSPADTSNGWKMTDSQKKEGENLSANEETEAPPSLPDNLSDDAKEYIKGGGRKPKLAPQADPRIQEIGRRFRQMSLEIVEIVEAGPHTRYHCRPLIPVKEMAAKFVELLSVCECRCYREYMLKEDEDGRKRFVAAFVVEHERVYEKQFLQGLTQAIELTWKPVTEYTLPTTNPDRNRPESPFSPLGGFGQRGVHRTQHPLAAANKRARRRGR